MTTYQVAASADDALYRDDLGTTDIDGSLIGSGATSVFARSRLNLMAHAGFRFLNVAISQGQTIASASLQADLLAGSAEVFTIYGEDVDNSVAFVNNAAGDEIGSRARTTANTVLNNATPSAGLTNYDVTAQVQEIVDRVGWASGNALTLLLIGANNNDGASVVPATYTAFDGTPANAAQLVIELESAAVPHHPTNPTIPSVPSIG